MVLEQASAIIAFVSAVAAVVVTVIGVVERRRAFKAQQTELQKQADRWQAEFKAERRQHEVSVRKEFLLEQYRYRLAYYPAVLQTLGSVSDVTLGFDTTKYEALRQNKELLTATADALYSHLYGEAGLLMTMHTRNVLHEARRQCVAFLNSDAGSSAGDRLVDAFFYARRTLRADLDLIDDRTPDNLQRLVDKLYDELAAGTTGAQTMPTED